MRKFSLDIKELDRDLSGKVCAKCLQFKDWANYNKGKQTYCVACIAEKNRATHPAIWRITDAKRRAREAGLPFDLEEHRAEIISIADTGCQLTGLPFDLSPKGGRGARNLYSFSIDRIEGAKGYVWANCRFVLWGLNIAFNNWGEDKFEIVARAWLEKRGR